MQSVYKLIFADKKFEGYKKLASFLFLLNSAIFVILGLGSATTFNKVMLFAVAFILIGYAAYNWKYKKKKEKSYILAYLLIAAIWITNTAFWYFAIIFLAMAFLQFKMEADLSVSLSSENIAITSLFRKNYNWSEFSNIVLKDELLTLDFTNNKIFQARPDWVETLDNNKLSLEDMEDYYRMEKEFNDFCRKQLNSLRTPINSFS